MSKRLQLIEQELNTTLFIRTSKGVIFTPEGEYVAKRARSILDAIEDVQHNLGYGIISDSRFFRSNPELYSVPMINKDGTTFTRKTWMVYHPAELENHLAKNFIEYVKEIDFENF